MQVNQWLLNHWLLKTLQEVNGVAMLLAGVPKIGVGGEYKTIVVGVFVAALA
jgi:hypothetical protein